jgi:hypothetical protein
MQRQFKVAVRKARVPKRATCHTMRHSFATHLLESGTDIRAVQCLMGYASVETTMIYLHVTKRTGAGGPSPLDLSQFANFSTTQSFLLGSSSMAAIAALRTQFLEKYAPVPYLPRLNRTRLLPDKCRTLLINTVRSKFSNGVHPSICCNPSHHRRRPRSR